MTMLQYLRSVILHEKEFWRSARLAQQFVLPPPVYRDMVLRTPVYRDMVLGAPVYRDMVLRAPGYRYMAV